MNTSSVIVVVAHPQGDIEVPLEEWIAVGPGPRILVRPVAAKDARTGKALPLETVPLQYRNDVHSIAMIINGELEDPWGRDKEELRRALRRSIAIGVERE